MVSYIYGFSSNEYHFFQWGVSEPQPPVQSSHGKVRQREDVEVAGTKVTLTLVRIRFFYLICFEE